MGEMDKLKWVDARGVLDTLDAAHGKDAIVPSLGSRFRSWTQEEWAYPEMAQNSDFRRFCSRKDNKRKRDQKNPVESKALERKKKKPKVDNFGRRILASLF